MGVLEDYEKAVWDADHDNCTLGELEEAEQRLKDSIFEWTPVTERLPEEDGDYLVTTSSFYGATIYVTTRNFSDGEWTYDRAVTAWMPLPKPYEGSEKNEDSI